MKDEKEKSTSGSIGFRDPDENPEDQSAEKVAGPAEDAAGDNPDDKSNAETESKPVSEAGTPPESEPVPTSGEVAESDDDAAEVVPEDKPGAVPEEESPMAEQEACAGKLKECEIKLALTLAAAEAGVPPSSLRYIPRLADVSSIPYAAGVPDEAAVKSTLKKILADIPALRAPAKPPEEPKKHVQIGADSDGEVKKNKPESGKTPAPRKPWNRFK